jgi:hypothetical protein
MVTFPTNNNKEERLVSKEGSGLYYLNKKYEGLRLINYIMTLIVFAQLNFNY